MDESKGPTGRSVLRLASPARVAGRRVRAPRLVPGGRVRRLSGEGERAALRDRQRNPGRLRRLLGARWLDTLPDQVVADCRTSRQPQEWGIPAFEDRKSVV